ncbi:MAG: hypothetical protein EOP08_12250 [Proteobacteria bacterium]|nr:MAG: hypothetical protein EOP08_12250 [Pseudomonadota bacterium]
MRTCFVFLSVVLLVACQRDTVQEAVLVPGASMGPVRLGATRADLAALGLSVGGDPSGQAGDQASYAGPFTLIFDAAEHVESVAVDLSRLSRGLHFASSTLAQSTTYEEAIAALAPCDPPRPYVGGTSTTCQGGGVHVERSSVQHAPLRIRVLKK